MHYLDTSVLAAYYLPESRSSGVQNLLSKVKGPTISLLVEVELCCAVARKRRAGELSESAARAVFAQFQAQLGQSCYAKVSVESAHYLMARDWITTLATPLRMLDALHMAVASANNLKLLTCDRQLALAAEHFGLPCTLVP